MYTEEIGRSKAESCYVQRLSRRHINLIVVVLVLAVPAIYVARIFAFLGGVFVFTKKWLRRAERGREHLFRETDYVELLAACRELLHRQASDVTTGKYYRVHLGKRDVETLTFPSVILDLEPATVSVSPVNYGEVIIELFPGPEWFGLIASAEGHEGHGDVKLIEGLWYFDTAYSDKHPQYVERIHTMIEEGRRQKESRKAVSTSPAD